MQKSLKERFNIKVSGKGTRPIMFIHGLGCDQTIWKKVVPAFEDEYKVILFDHMGAGESNLSFYDPEKYSSLEGYASDIISIVNELDLSKVILIGHSVSNMIGLLAVIAAPDLFEKIVMVSPSPCYINDHSYIGGFARKEIENLLGTMRKSYIDWAIGIAPVIMANPDQPQFAHELKESFCKRDPAITQQFAAVTFLSDNRGDLSKLKIPTLIMQCSQDVIAPLQVGEFMERNIPYATLRIMKATGHCPHVSAPAETIEMIKEFL